MVGTYVRLLDRLEELRPEIERLGLYTSKRR
jgi:hypothetical protein